MRDLVFKDVFVFSEILDKMQIKIDLNELIGQAEVHPDAQAFIGGQIIMLLLSNMHKAEKEVYKFIGSLTDKTPKQAENMSISEVRDVFMKLMESDDIAVFFSSATTGK